jgi:hypothetical protein
VTGKILVRELRREKFLSERPRGQLYWRERGDTTFKALTPEFQSLIRARFTEAGRGHLLAL